jgi:A/G-specific adenine glycosylase
MDTKKITKFRTALLRWYRKNARHLPWRETTDPYAIWVSEVMLQQTQVKTVRLFYDKFMRAFPDMQRLAQADLQDVLKQWEGLGYYARARNLHRAARLVVADHQGVLPADGSAIQKLPGIGDYIAAAVLSIAFNQPYPVVDGNVKRVLARLFEMDLPVNQAAAFKQFYAKSAQLLDPRRPGDFNQAMMELGALVCTPTKPHCDTCPVHLTCLAFDHGTVHVYPQKIQAKPVPKLHLAVGVVFRKDRVLITRRPPEGLLGGLWEFPGGEVKSNEQPEKACVRVLKQAVNLTVTADRFLTQVTHAYTHFKIKADVFMCTYRSGTPALAQAVDYRWVHLDHLDQYPFPKANHKFFDALLAAVTD